MKRCIGLAAAAVLALVFAACEPAPTGSTVGPVGFETPDYTTGNINGQQGWSKTGPYDSEVSAEAASHTTPGAFGFGDQALRISNSVTSGSFGDQTISPSTGDHSGETTADGGGLVSGAQHGYFDTSWAFADAGNPEAEQENLVVEASPDRGDGSRMSFIQMADCSVENNSPFEPKCEANGLEVDFYDYDPAIGPTGANGGFVQHVVASGLSRFDAHTIRTQMWFFEGANNDVVKVCVDGTHCTTGGSWEDFYRDGAAATNSVDSVLFHTRTSNGTCTNCDGNGFFVDDFVEKSVSYDGATVNVTGPTTVAEGGTGSDATVPYTISLSEPLPFTVKVPFHTVNGTASDSSDYDPVNGTATFAPGETTKTVNVTVHGDATDESNETYSLALDQPTTVGRNTGDPSGTFVFRHNNSKKTTITDDDSTVSVSDASATEPASGHAPMVFTVSLANPSSVPVTVQYSTVDGTATHPADFTAKSNVTVTFSPGQVTKHVNVQIAADDVVEGDEFFSVHLHDADANTAIGTAVGTGTIHDAD